MADSDGLNADSAPALPEYYQGLNTKVFNLIPVGCLRLLEVGCASGMLGKAVKARNPKAYYAGIEMFPAAADLARNNLDKVFLADAERFDWSLLAGEKFDCIIFADVLEHLVDPAKVLRAASGLLSRDGFVVCCIPNISHWSIISGLIRGKWDYADSGLLDRTHLRFFTVRSFLEFLKDCGFHAVAEDRWWTPPFADDLLHPLLEAMQVDKAEFRERSSTVQFAVRAQRIGPQSSVPTGAVGNQAELPKKSVPSVSIFVSMGSSPENIRVCLDALASTYSRKFAPDITVVDGDPNCETPGLPESYAVNRPWLKHLVLPAGRGWADLRNRAAGASGADLLVFLDGDCVVQPFWLEKMVEWMADGRIGLVAPMIVDPSGKILQAGLSIDPQGIPIHLHRSLDQGDERANRPKSLPGIGGECMVVRRELFQRTSGFSPDFPQEFADLDFCFQIRRLGFLVVCQSESRVVYPGEARPSGSQMDTGSFRAARSGFLEKWKDLLMVELSKDPVFYGSGRDYIPL